MMKLISGVKGMITNIASNTIKKLTGGIPKKKHIKLHNSYALKDHTHKSLGPASGGGEAGKPTGIGRMLAGAAEAATGGFFDFDKQGHSLYQASGIMKKTGEIIDNAKQKAQEERYKKLQKSINESQGIVNINDGGGGLPIGSSAVDDVPILIPGDDHMDADKYLKPKYGLIAEFLTDPVEFM